VENPDRMSILEFEAVLDELAAESEEEGDDEEDDE
jgi:hypothetical protein